MAVKVTSDEPNTFPAVDGVRANPQPGGVEMILVTRVDGQATRVAVKLSTRQAEQLGKLLLEAAGTKAQNAG